MINSVTSVHQLARCSHCSGDVANRRTNGNLIERQCIQCGRFQLDQNDQARIAQLMAERNRTKHGDPEEAFVSSGYANTDDGNLHL